MLNFALHFFEQVGMEGELEKTQQLLAKLARAGQHLKIIQPALAA